MDMSLLFKSLIGGKGVGGGGLGGQGKDILCKVYWANQSGHWSHSHFPFVLGRNHNKQINFYISRNK